MIPKTTKLGKYSVTYLCKEEYKIISNEIFSKQIYKINLSPSSPHIFDIGSHIGLSILYFKKIYPNSIIQAFEPNPNVYPILQENIEQNRLKNVKIHNIALGQKNTKRTFYIDSSGTCAFSTASFKKNAWNGKQQTLPILVNTEKLSDYINHNIDLLKMDIEGAEKEVLEDLRINKKMKYVKNIIFEYHPDKKHKIGRVITKFLSDYKIKATNMGEGLILILGQKRP